MKANIGISTWSFGCCQHLFEVEVSFWCHPFDENICHLPWNHPPTWAHVHLFKTDLHNHYNSSHSYIKILLTVQGVFHFNPSRVLGDNEISYSYLIEPTYSKNPPFQSHFRPFFPQKKPEELLLPLRAKVLLHSQGIEHGHPRCRLTAVEGWRLLMFGRVFLKLPSGN